MAQGNYDGSEYGSGAVSPQTLLDLCVDAFRLIFHIRAGNDPGHPDDLRKNVSLLLRNLEAKAHKSEHAEEDVKATRYALCALIDETILNSRWAFKDQWAARPLQLEHFGEQLAGERFFDLLERIRQKGRKKADLLEVFCVVLILGFQGKYKLHAADQLQQFIRKLVDEIQGYRGSPAGLSPHWRVPEERPEKAPQSAPLWAWITAGAAIATVLILFVVFKLWLGSVASDAVRQMML